MAPTLVFDIETIPDARGLRAAWSIEAGLSDEQVVERALQMRRERTGGSDFLPLHLHRIVAIACLMRAGRPGGPGADGAGDVEERFLRVGCIGSAQDEEARLIQEFYGLIDRYTPQLVSWNGAGFDLQVLHYRGLINRVQAPRYWESGDEDREFRWNNYLGRYHSRHLDLMDQLALFTPRANAPLDELAKLCGFPGKLGMDGSQVWNAWREGKIAEIRDYCETDVANTWLVYCRFQLMRGIFDPARYEAEIALVRQTLERLAAGPPDRGAHWREFLQAWPQA